MMTVERVFPLSAAARRSLEHSASPMRSTHSHFSLTGPRWHFALLGGLSGARDLLDRLENTRRTNLAMRILDDGRFEVRWREPQSPPA